MVFDIIIPIIFALNMFVAIINMGVVGFYIDDNSIFALLFPILYVANYCLKDYLNNTGRIILMILLSVLIMPSSIAYIVILTLLFTVRCVANLYLIIFGKRG